MLRPFVTLMLALAVAGCSASGSQDAAAPSDLVPSTVTPGALATILDYEPLDPATATDVSSLFAVDTGGIRSMAPGTWYAGSFSTPILFNLPVDGFLAQIGNGLVVIEVGEDSADFDAAIEIVEVVAYSGENGPVPIGEVAPDAAWGGATKIASGVVEGPNGPITWVDVVYEAENVDEARTHTCPYQAANPCLDAIVIEQNALSVELNRAHRYVTFELEGSRLVVALVSPRFSDAEFHEQLAIDVAASITPTPRREASDSGPRFLDELRVTSGLIPAGTWAGGIDGSILTFTVDEDIEGIRVDGIARQGAWFSTRDGSESLVFFAFQRFVPELDVRVPTIDAPLTNEEFFTAMDQVIDVTVAEEATIGGLPAVRFEQGGEHNPAFACPPELRSEIGLSSVAQCSVWATSDLGPLAMDDEESGTPQEAFYVESVGLLVFVPVDEADPNGAFAELLDSLELSKP